MKQTQIIAIALQKGGTGKTTTAAALTEAAAYRGETVLAIDLDPQGNLSFALAADMTTSSSYDLLTGKPAADITQHISENMHVIPAGVALQTITTGKGSARRLENALEPLRGQYDTIIIDTPPTVGALQYNALQAATGLVIPLQADIYNLQSLYQITETAQQIQASNPALQILGYVLTQYDGRSTIARSMRDNIQAQAENIGIQYLGAIRKAVAIQEAAALQRSLFEYAPNSKPAADYMALYERINGH